MVHNRQQGLIAIQPIVLSRVENKCQFDVAFKLHYGSFPLCWQKSLKPLFHCCLFTKTNPFLYFFFSSLFFRLFSYAECVFPVMRVQLQFVCTFVTYCFHPFTPPLPSDFLTLNGSRNSVLNSDLLIFRFSKRGVRVFLEYSTCCSQSDISEAEAALMSL